MIVHVNYTTRYATTLPRVLDSSRTPAGYQRRLPLVSPTEVKVGKSVFYDARNSDVIVDFERRTAALLAQYSRVVLPDVPNYLAMYRPGGSSIILRSFVVRRERFLDRGEVETPGARNRRHEQTRVTRESIVGGTERGNCDRFRSSTESIVSVFSLVGRCRTSVETTK